MKNPIKIFGFLLVSGLILVQFQNCNKISMAPMQATDKLSGIDGVNGPSGSDGGVSVDPSTTPEQDADEPSSDELIATCAQLKGNGRDAESLNNGADISNLHGNNFLQGDQIKRIDSVYGSFTIVGTTTSSRIESLTHSFGSVLVCNMDIGLIADHTSGHFVVVNGNVGDVNRFNGNLRIINGKVTGSVSNINGNVYSQ